MSLELHKFERPEDAPAAPAKAPAIVKRIGSDSVLIEASDSSLSLERLAVLELRQHISEYLEPNLRSRRMVDDYEKFIASNGESNEQSYMNMRGAYIETRGKSNRVFADVLAAHIPKRRISSAGTMFPSYVASATNLGAAGMVNAEDGEDETAKTWDRNVGAAARTLEAKGWWKCRDLASPALVASLKRKIMAKLEKDHGDAVAAAVEGAPGAPKQLKVNSAPSSSFSEMYELSADPLLLSIVQAYLGVPPIFNTPVAFLNSVFKFENKKQLEGLGQLYHHDMHRLKFVKVFVYLTDVDEGSGPHTLVSGTHRRRPDSLWAESRFSDDDVVKAGVGADEVRITGKAGTVFLVDTSCLHKGSSPEKESRLMAQVQYVNTLFGKPISKSDHKVKWLRDYPKGRNIYQEEAALLVRKYAQKSGVRFMQNYI